MADRIDHAADSRTWLEGAERADLTEHATMALAAVAQVHATLALVEQQRIANLQVERDEIRRRYEGRHDAAATLAVRRLNRIDGHLALGLGL